MMKENQETNTWRIEKAENEKQILVMEGVISLEDLRTFMVYQLIRPATERPEKEDQIVINGALACACGYTVPIKEACLSFKGFLDAPSKYLDSCSQCWRGLMVVGETTGTGDSIKQWLLLTATTGKPGAVEMPGTLSGLPELHIDQIEIVLAKIAKPESSKEKLAETIETSKKSETKDEQPTGPSMPMTAGDVMNGSGEDQLPSETIAKLFNKRAVNPEAQKIVAAVFLYERIPAQHIWVGPGPDPFAVGEENDHTRHLRILLTKSLPSFQPHYIPAPLKIETGTLITGRQLQPGERIDIDYINPMLAVMLADLLEDHHLLNILDLNKCAAISISGDSLATGEARFAFLIT